MAGKNRDRFQRWFKDLTDGKRLTEVGREARYDSSTTETGLGGQESANLIPGDWNDPTAVPHCEAWRVPASKINCSEVSHCPSVATF